MNDEDEPCHECDYGYIWDVDNRGRSVRLACWKCRPDDAHHGKA